MPKTIWLLDDEQEILLILAEILQGRHEIEAFSDPRELVKAITHGRRPNAIVTDYHMPNLNGLDLARRINDAGCTAPLILISGYVNKNVGLDAINAHVFKILEKPFTPRDLNSAIEQALAYESILTDSRDLRRTAHRFFQVAFEAMQAYKLRAEDAERVLKELDLLPGSAERQLQRILEASDLQRQADELKSKLSQLEASENTLTDASRTG